jgi:type I restriction enzyme S subunit
LLPFQKQIANLIKKAEQKHIEAKNRIDKAKQILINTLEVQLHKIRERKEYFISSLDLKDMFIPKFYYPLYVDTIKEIEKKFRTVLLGEISKITKGNEVGSKNYRSYLEKEDTDVPFIRTSDIVNNEIDNYPDFYISKKTYDDLKQNIRPGDILFTKDGKIGLTAIVVKGDKCIVASGIAKIRVNKYDPYYIFTVLDTFIGTYQANQRTVISSTLPHLRPERLEEIKIPIISEDKQKEISQLVREAFELKRQKKELIKKSKEKIEEIFE